VIEAMTEAMIDVEIDAVIDPLPPFTFCRPQAIVDQDAGVSIPNSSPFSRARRGSRSRPPLRRPRPLRFERLRVPVWNPYGRGRLSPAKSEDRKGGEGKTDANLTIFFSTCCAPLGAPRRFRNPKIGQQLGAQPTPRFRVMLAGGTEGSFLCSLITDFLAEGAGWGASPGRGGELGCHRRSRCLKNL